ncbi:MAG: Uma2 family endonuclease [Hyphomicrobium sp.]|nr:Uma2 family endonuclease [Hyphomicrobium sp.]
MDDGAEPKTTPHMTAGEFIDWDGGGHLGKMELVHGEVRAMSPASGTHATIQANLAYLIGAHLRAKKMPCRVGTEAPIQPQMHANDNVRAPDLAVTCAPPTSAKTFPDPVLIIEVMSPSNRQDTWDSIYALSTITSLAEIMIVESESVRAEVFHRLPEGGWPKTGVVSETGESVRLDSIGAEFPVAEIYAGTHLI